MYVNIVWGEPEQVHDMMMHANAIVHMQSVCDTVIVHFSGVQSYGHTSKMHSRGLLHKPG